MINIKSILKNIKYSLLKSNGIFYPKYADDFYSLHQKNLRGSYKEIRKRQSVYIKYCTKIPLINRKKNSFIDIGFGRGEFIDLLYDNKFTNIEGVDINEEFVSKADKNKFEIYHDDGIRHMYLSEKKYYGISAFHLIEHIDFPQLFDLLLICSKKLVKGGILILETPNVENIKVGSTTFYLDYTHKLKLPVQLLTMMLKYFGFTKVEVLYLQPEKTTTQGINQLLYGARDLGIVAYK